MKNLNEKKNTGSSELFFALVMLVLGFVSLSARMDAEKILAETQPTELHSPVQVAGK